MMTRRRFALSALATFLPHAPAQARDLAARFEAIERESGGRLGVAVLDGASGALEGYRLDERFALCSTAKTLVAAAILARVDAGRESLERRLPVAQADILSYAPVTKAHVGEAMTVGELCAAAITLSDNTAANLLVAALGGPAAVTAFARGLGDETTRLDRVEPDLNEAAPGDPRDTTTPAAMARSLGKIALGDALTPASRARFVDWLIQCRTGGAKLRAGLPAGWRVGDKTGAGGHGANNDVAVIWPPGRAPLVVASYLAQNDLSDARRNAVHAAVARALAG